VGSSALGYMALRLVLWLVLELAVFMLVPLQVATLGGQVQLRLPLVPSVCFATNFRVQVPSSAIFAPNRRLSGMRSRLRGAPRPLPAYGLDPRHHQRYQHGEEDNCRRTKSHFSRGK